MADVLFPPTRADPRSRRRCDRRRPPAPCAADCPLRARLHRTGRRSWAERGWESRSRRELRRATDGLVLPPRPRKGRKAEVDRRASGLDDLCVARQARGRGLPRPPPRRPQPSGAGTRRPRSPAPATIAVSANPGQTTLIAMPALERRRHAADEADDGVLRRRIHGSSGTAVSPASDAVQTIRRRTASRMRDDELRGRRRRR